MRKVMEDMTDSERLLFTQKLQMILVTMGRLQEEEIRNERKAEELKEAREGKRKLFEK